MNRRKFLSTSQAAFLPLLLPKLRAANFPSEFLSFALPQDSQRVLVLIQLDGGNDGLNTVIPVDQYDTLREVRSNIILPERKILKLNDTLGLHPVMTGIRRSFEEGQISIIQNVGYPDQNRSHFRSTDIWSSGSPVNQRWQTGWLGRCFEERPNHYIDNASIHPLAISMGRIVSETCQGIMANYGVTLNDPFAISPLPESKAPELPDSPSGRTLAFINNTIQQTNKHSETILQAAKKGSNIHTYPANNLLANQLKNVARLISGGLNTSVYICRITGFDTHANQIDQSDSTVGTHADLLKTFSDAVSAFLADLKKLNLDRKVLGCTFSEFGRRIRSNGSIGTDHGTAAPMFLFGSCVQSPVVGDNPLISMDATIQDGVPMQFDFRDVYGSILEDWFEVDPSLIRSLLYEDYQNLGILSPCETLTSQSTRSTQLEVSLNCYPNPFQNQVNIQFDTNNREVSVQAYDSFGRIIKRLYEGQPNSLLEIQWNTSNLSPGNYLVSLRSTDGLQLLRKIAKT